MRSAVDAPPVLLEYSTQPARSNLRLERTAAGVRVTVLPAPYWYRAATWAFVLGLAFAGPFGLLIGYNVHRAAGLRGLLWTSGMLAVGTVAVAMIMAASSTGRRAVIRVRRGSLSYLTPVGGRCYRRDTWAAEDIATLEHVRFSPLLFGGSCMLRLRTTDGYTALIGAGNDHEVLWLASVLKSALAEGVGAGEAAGAAGAAGRVV